MRTVRFLSRYWVVPAVISLVVEVGLMIGAIELASRVRNSLMVGSSFFSTTGVGLDPHRIVLFAVVVIVTLYFSGHYDFAHRFGRRQLWLRLARALSLSVGILLVVYYLTDDLLSIGRLTLVLAIFLIGLLFAGWRELLAWLLRKEMFGSRILIVGADEAGAELATEILTRGHLGYKIIGFVDDDPGLQGVSVVNPSVIGTTAQVCQLAQEHRATMIVVALRQKRGKLDLDSLLQCKTYGIPVQDGPTFFEQLTGKISLENLRKSWLVFSKGFVVAPATLAPKRLLDILVALLLLILTAPVMLLAALAIRLTSPGPILYRQERVGLRGRVFTLLKFRSMYQDAETRGEAVWAQADDPRVTRVGRFLRKFRLDELPQLWNVLVADMSLVGPRPERPPFVARLQAHNPFYNQRHEVRPGITGWAQIMAPYASSVEESLEKLQYDLFYVKNLSLFLDLSILLSTTRILVLGRGAR